MGRPEISDRRKQRSGDHIPKHRGPSRTIFTAHLGLLLPQDRASCWIRVDGDERSWEPGKLLVADDTYEHEVRNDTGEDRALLLLHLRRPVRFPASLVRDVLFSAIKWSPVVRDGLRNHRGWEERITREEERSPEA